MLKGIVVVDRQYWLRLATMAGQSQPNELRVSWFQDLCLRYKGFDGEFWPGNPPPSLSEEFCVPLQRLPEVERYYASVRSQFCELLFVSKVSDAVDSAQPPEGFSFAGYDVGYCDEYEGHYSCIFHEILQGENKVLNSFGANLNANKLFSSSDVAIKYQVTRQQIQSSGYDLETGPISIFAISLRLAPS